MVIVVFVIQKNYFNNIVGCDKDSGLSFPNHKSIARAYQIDYISIKDINELDEKLSYVFSLTKPIICEVYYGSRKISKIRSH